MVDYLALLRLSEFLRIPAEEVFLLYVDLAEQRYEPKRVLDQQKITFIKNNFDIGALKKEGVISNLNDYNDIDNKMCSLLGINTIYEYQRPKKKSKLGIEDCFSSNSITRDLWIVRARNILEEIL